MWAKRRYGPQAKKAILYLYVEKDWVNKLHEANNEPDEIKGIRQTPVVIGPIDALAPSRLGRLQESKEVAAGTFNDVRANLARHMISTKPFNKFFVFLKSYSAMEKRQASGKRFKTSLLDLLFQ